MKTESELKAMQSDPQMQAWAKALAERVIFEEQDGLVRASPGVSFEYFAAHVLAQTAYRLAMMTTLAAEEGEVQRKEIEALKNENAELRKRLIPDGIMADGTPGERPTTKREKI